MALLTLLVLCTLCLHDARGEAGIDDTPRNGDFLFLEGLTYETPADAADEILRQKGEVSTDVDLFTQERKYTGLTVAGYQASLTLTYGKVLSSEVTCT